MRGAGVSLRAVPGTWGCHMISRSCEALAHLELWPSSGGKRMVEMTPSGSRTSHTHTYGSSLSGPSRALATCHAMHATGRRHTCFQQGRAGGRWQRATLHATLSWRRSGARGSARREEAGQAHLACGHDEALWVDGQAPDVVVVPLRQARRTPAADRQVARTQPPSSAGVPVLPPPRLARRVTSWGPSTPGRSAARAWRGRTPRPAPRCSRRRGCPPSKRGWRPCCPCRRTRTQTRS